MSQEDKKKRWVHRAQAVIVESNGQFSPFLRAVLCRFGWEMQTLWVLGFGFSVVQERVGKNSCWQRGWQRAGSWRNLDVTPQAVKVFQEL